MMRKPGKNIELTNTAQIECWRQRLNKEEKQVAPKVRSEIKRLEDKLAEKNSYFNNYKKGETVKKEQEIEKTRTNFAYDHAGVDTGDQVLDRNAIKCSKYKHDS